MRERERERERERPLQIFMNATASVSRRSPGLTFETAENAVRRIIRFGFCNGCGTGASSNTASINRSAHFYREQRPPFPPQKDASGQYLFRLGI